MRSNLKCRVLKGDHRNDVAFFCLFGASAVSNIVSADLCSYRLLLARKDGRTQRQRGRRARGRRRGERAKIFPTVDLKRRRVNRLLSKVNKKVFFLPFYFILFLVSISTWKNIFEIHLFGALRTCLFRTAVGEAIMDTAACVSFPIFYFFYFIFIGDALHLQMFFFLW